MMKGMPDISSFKGLTTSGGDALISLGGAAIINTVFGKVWGLYSEFGAPIVLCDGVLGISFTSSSDVSSAPLEKGTFASYNKVDNPDQAVVQLTKGSGGVFQRGAFLTQLIAYKGSTLKFHVVSPEFVHRNMTITDLDYARSAKEGLQLIVVNVQLEEIREIKLEYMVEEVTNPSDAENVDSGSVQPKTAQENVSEFEKLRRRITG